LAVAVMVFVDVPGDRGSHPTQFVHAAWSGFRVAEFAFPAFIVASGAAIGVAGRPKALGPTLARAARIFAIGLVIIWAKYRMVGFESGTLQFIAVAWLIAALLARLPARWRVLLAAGWFATVIGLHEVAILPGTVGWSAHSIGAWVDTPIFGARSDLGVLGMITAGCTAALASVVTATLRDQSSRRRALGFAAAGGVALVAAVLLVDAGVPVVKRAWTPSYVLLGAGLAMAVLALAECVTATRLRGVARPFTALGLNALPLYVLMSAIGLGWSSAARAATTRWLVREGLPPTVASSAIPAVVLLVLLAVASWWQRRGRIIRM
jgi:predicted acyltransferase